MSTLGGEQYSVQKPILQYVQESEAKYVAHNGAKVFLKLGWKYVTPDEAMRLRGGETSIIFRDVFISQLQKLNPGVARHV